MKSLLAQYRATLLILLVAVSFTACKKDNPDPSPDLGNRVAGQYTFSELSFNGQTRPASQTNLKGSVRVVRQTATSVSMQLDIRSKSGDEEFLVGSVENIDLTNNGNDVELRAQGDKIAYVSSNKLIINGRDDNNTEFTITATK
ncbi:hypothetical protein GCM10027341_34990 [Spirosoma knui]